jgi:hypothetical protein
MEGMEIEGINGSETPRDNGEGNGDTDVGDPSANAGGPNPKDGPKPNDEVRA